MAEMNTKYTFWKLINEFKVQIPIMQRDYAQGRVSDKVDPIRAEFLESIHSALQNEKNIDFDFVYGTAENGTLYPLDGQQRITTLFLLHWYIACKEGRREELGQCLKNFTYETRVSSREFCNKLADMEYDPNEGDWPTDYIHDQKVYFSEWDKDPTIASMMVMLDDIHEEFCDDDKAYFDLLIRDIEDDPVITFNYLPMENYALTDDLYIKMNARGKNLSDFENYKAKFIQHMKKNNLPYEHFEESIDTVWTDLLWDYRSSVNNTIDEQFMYLFTFFTEMLFLEHADPQNDGNSPFKVTDIRGLISFYDSEEKVEELYELLDLWRCKKEIDECFDSIFSDQYCEGKVRIFDDKHNLFDATIDRNGLKIYNKVLLFLFMKRLIYFKKQEKTDDSIVNYIRILRNFVIKVRQRKYENYTPDFRFCRHGIPYVDFGLGDLLGEEDIYGFIFAMEDSGGINSESLKNEKEKAEYILQNPDMEEYIHQLEDMDEFRGCIQNIMPFIRERHVDGLAENIHDLFSEQFFEVLVRAMLSVKDYGIRLGGSAYGDRFFYGNRVSNWYNVLSTTANPDYPEIISAFLEQYYDAESSDVKESLEIIIDNNLPSLNKDDWRYYFVKYPRLLSVYPDFLDAKNLVILLEESEFDDFCVPHRLNGKQLTGYHACALYLEVAMRLSGDTRYIQLGKDAHHLSCLQFKSGTRVELSANSYVEVEAERGVDITDRIADKALELWEDNVYDDMDYVEQLELMGKCVIDAEMYLEP